MSEKVLASLRFVSMVSAALALTSAHADAQPSPVAPMGAQNVALGPGTGVTSPVSPTGGFATAVPLDLPAARGGVPVPLSIGYTASPRVGAAGAGWDIPLSYVRVSEQAWRRKPIAGSDPAEIPKRVLLTLDGATAVMLGDGRFDVEVDEPIAVGIAKGPLRDRVDVRRVGPNNSPLYEVSLSYSVWPGTPIIARYRDLDRTVRTDIVSSVTVASFNNLTTSASARHRFLQRDPIAVVASSSISSPYAFSWSDPVNLSDPSGMSPLTTEYGPVSGSFAAWFVVDVVGEAVTLLQSWNHRPTTMGLNLPGFSKIASFNIVNDLILPGGRSRYDRALGVIARFALPQLGLFTDLVDGNDGPIVDLDKLANGTPEERAEETRKADDWAATAVGFGNAPGGAVPSSDDGVAPNLGNLPVNASETALTLHHGTDIQTGIELLNGGALDEAKAQLMKIDGAPGFYLATDAADAEYFALRRGAGVVLDVRFSARAVKALGGLASTPLGRLGNFGTFAGGEVRIAVEAFSRFNVLRAAGEITILPH